MLIHLFAARIRIPEIFEGDSDAMVALKVGTFVLSVGIVISVWIFRRGRKSDRRVIIVFRDRVEDLPSLLLQPKGKSLLHRNVLGLIGLEKNNLADDPLGERYVATLDSSAANAGAWLTPTLREYLLQHDHWAVEIKDGRFLLYQRLGSRRRGRERRREKS